MTDSRQRPDPDAWEWIECLTDINGEYKEIVSHSEEHPSSKEVQFYLSQDHDWKNAKPLWSESTIKQEIDRRIEYRECSRFEDKDTDCVEQAVVMGRCDNCIVRQSLEELEEVFSGDEL